MVDQETEVGSQRVVGHVDAVVDVTVVDRERERRDRLRRLDGRSERPRDDLLRAAAATVRSRETAPVDRPGVSRGKASALPVDVIPIKLRRAQAATATVDDLASVPLRLVVEPFDQEPHRAAPGKSIIESHVGQRVPA